MTSWDQYLPSLTVDAEKKKITVGGMILDSNGNPLAKSPELDLLAYDHEMELDDGTTKKVSVNEFVILQNLIKTGKPGSECGVRFGKKKYMDVTKADANPGERYFKGSKVGAMICKLNSIVLFVMWDEEKGHVASKVAKQIGGVADYLKSSGL